jgi:IS1 family transposase
MESGMDCLDYGGLFADVPNCKSGKEDTAAIVSSRKIVRHIELLHKPSAFSGLHRLSLKLYLLALESHFVPLSNHLSRLSSYRTKSPTQQQDLETAYHYQQQVESPVGPICPVTLARHYRHGGKFADSYGVLCIFGMFFSVIALGWPTAICFDRGWRWQGCCLAGCALTLGLCGCLSGIIGCLPWNWWACLHDGQEHSQGEYLHSGTIVLQKYLDNLYYCSTVIRMANVLDKDKQIAIIGALAEGSSIRSIERITGVHRDTIMRLGVKVGEGCAKTMDTAMRDLPCNRLEMDEIWGFVGKKDRNVREGEDGVGSVWTFCVIDAETKLVPAFKVGNRDVATATEFVKDVADRMAYRVQISTDGLSAYVIAMQNAFGEFVDYAQIIKTYGHEEVNDNRRYSAPKFVSSEKKIIVGNPDERLISTSYIERLNATTRLHMRRLTRLTLAFSKKRENFEAAVALHFAYYNFVKRHSTLRCTPAMAAGVTGTFWEVGDLLEAAA